jgi:hypothetical protein
MNGTTMPQTTLASPIDTPAAARRARPAGLAVLWAAVLLGTSPWTAAQTTPAPAAPAAAPPAAVPVAPPATAPAGAGVPAGIPVPTDATGDLNKLIQQREAEANTRGLDQDIQGLKKDVVDLNKDLFVLEEELLFPANTQVAVFLSMDVGTFFSLDSVQLKIDQKEVINYLYTQRERDALLKGGVQRLYLGNLKVGQHELVAFFNGKGPNDRAYKRGASIRFEKGVGAKYLELKIDDRQKKLEPEFEIKDWE